MLTQKVIAWILILCCSAVNSSFYKVSLDLSASYLVVSDIVKNVSCQADVLLIIVNLPVLVHGF